MGYRTAVLSTDPAHSLGDSFDRRIGSDLVELAPQPLGAGDRPAQPDGPVLGHGAQDYLNALFAWQGMESLVAEETAVLPGMEELASLLQITALADSGNYDVIIIDAAPTGSTLQLLSFPDMARWYLEKIFPFQRKTIQIARPVVRRMTDMPMPDDDVFESIEELVVQLERMSQLLSDGNISSMRVVLNPEKMVVKEAQRAYTYLNLYGYSVDAVVCNRVFPRDLEDHYFDVWKKAQAANLELVHECFHPLPIFEVPFSTRKSPACRCCGAWRTRSLAPTRVKGGPATRRGKFYVGKPQDIFRRNGYYVLSIPLPLVEREEVHLHRSVFDELIVRIGNWKRNLVLPTGLAKLEVSGAKYEGDRLNILFAIPPGETIAVEELKPKRWDTLKARLRGK